MPSSSSAPRTLTWHDGILSASIFVVCLFLFLRSPVSYFGDSKYTLLLTQNLLSKGSFVLDAYAPPGSTPHGGESVVTTLHSTIPYQLETSHDSHYYYFFPPGSSILSTPFVLVGDLLGKNVVRPDGTYDSSQDERNQLFISSLLMALLALIFYFTSRLALPPGWSACVALGGALSTQIWSTATRAMWSHTWGCSLLGFVLYLLLAQETGRAKPHPVLLATALSWSYFVRPTNGIFILGVTVYLCLFYRARFLAYAAAGASWFVAFVAYSWYHFGKILPTYFQSGRLGSTTFTEALAGNLVSPGRGTLLYVPLTLFVVYLLARFWRYRSHPSLLWLALAVSVGQLLAVSQFPHWWGGDCYGPRFTTELVPWGVLLAILGLAAALRWHDDYSVPRRRFSWAGTLAAGGLLLFLGIWIHARGANVMATIRWNNRPVALDDNPWRLWQWRYPQALAGLIRPPAPAIFPRLPVGQRVLFGLDPAGRDAGKKYESVGWSDSEPGFVWTEDTRADLFFAADDLSANQIRLLWGPFLFGQQIPRQRIIIRINGRRIATINADKPVLVESVLALPAGALRPKNDLTFELPDAVPGSSLTGTSDTRSLGIALHWMELIATPVPSA